MTLPDSRAAASASARWGSSGARPGTSFARSSRARSFVPMTSADTRGCAAIARTSKIAVGVSTIAQISRSAGAPAAFSRLETRSSVCVEPTFGMTTAAAPERAAAARSSGPHCVSRPLQRIVSSRFPYPPDDAAATALARAPCLASGATASSRSKMIESAGNVFAFSKARSLAAGMYSTERRGRRSEAICRRQFSVARSQLPGELDDDLALLDGSVVFHLAVEHDRARAVSHRVDHTLRLYDIARSWTEDSLGDVDLNRMQAPRADAAEQVCVAELVLAADG